MTTSRVSYLGDLSTKCTHIKSGTEIITDAPTDNNGKGESFSPTDLMATSYASCMLTIIGIFCNNHNIEFKHGDAELTKVMASNPRRISKLEISFDFTNNNWDNKTQEKIKRAGEACPVAITLKDNIEVIITYKF